MKNNKLFYGLVFLVLLLLLVACQTPADEPSAAQEQASVTDTTAPPTEAPEEAATLIPPTATEEPAEPWQLVKQVQQEHNPSFAAFMNPEFGMTGCVGEIATLYLTLDGGQSWEESLVCDMHFYNQASYGLDIVDRQTIRWCGDYMVVSVNGNGQQSGQSESPMTEKCLFVSFADEQNGWAAGQTELVATEDGGNSWEALTLPETISLATGTIVAISLSTANDGYVLDSESTLYSTHDGGQTWSTQTLEFSNPDLEFMRVSAHGPAAIRFVDNQNGVVVSNAAGGGSGGVFALHTADGGQTWEEEKLPVEFGTLYLSHDGVYLTVTEIGSLNQPRNINIIEYKP